MVVGIVTSPHGERPDGGDWWPGGEQTPAPGGIVGEHGPELYAMPTDTIVYPQGGTIVFTTIGGALGWAIGLGQYLIGDGSRYSHVAVYVGGGQVVEAMPGGVRIAPLAPYLDGRPVAFGRVIPLTALQRQAICGQALRLVGTRYGFANYPAIALARFGRVPRRLAAYIASQRSVICSQLADLAYQRAGVPLFDDGRLPGYVTPGDLANLLIERRWDEA